MQVVRCCAWIGRGGGVVYCCVGVGCLSLLQTCGSVCPAATSSLMRTTAGVGSGVVDVYNGATGAWSTAQLSLARGYLAAASVGSVALFAGGWSNSALLCMEGGFRGVLCMLCECFVFCSCCGVAVLFALRPLPL